MTIETNANAEGDEEVKFNAKDVDSEDEANDKLHQLLRKYQNEARL